MSLPMEAHQPAPIPSANAEATPEASSKELLIGAVATADVSERINDPASLISEAATNVGLELTQDRLTTLTKMAENSRSSQQAGIKTFFASGGLSIQPATLSEGKKVVVVDFRPKTAQADQAETPQTQEVTKVALAGLEGMQDFALLVKTGFIERPDILQGRPTNPNMARAATRLGFSATGENPKPVADFQTVQDKVFSPEMVAYGKKLSDRLATMRPPKTPTTAELQ